jgi:LacI family transcriptional regulator
MSKKSKATIIDIAQKVNMTTVTVSRALNTPEKVKKETLDRILAVAKELNYVPNAFARNLKSRKSRLIGFITASLDNPFYEEMIKAISREAKKRDYSILLFDTDGSAELEERAVDTLLSYQVDGIILSAVTDDASYQPAYLPRLIHSAIPVVQVDREIASAPFAGVYLNNAESGYMGGRALLDKGYRHLLVVGGWESSEITLARLAGVRRALDECADKTVMDVLYGDYTLEPAYSAVLDYLKKGHRPNAIFGLNVLITLGSVKAIRHAGLPLSDFGVFSIDRVPYANVFADPIPCVAHDTYQIGLHAITMLLNQIDNPDYAPVSEVVSGRLE